MIYRLRTYKTIPARNQDFHVLFHGTLAPLFAQHGATLVGRWQSEDGTRIVAIFAYKDQAHYQTSDAATRRDPAYLQAMQAATQAGPLYESFEDLLMTSSVDLLP